MTDSERITKLEQTVSQLLVTVNLLLNNAPIIYTQFPDEQGLVKQDGIFRIKMLSSDDNALSTNTLVFFLPSENSIEGENKLILKYPYRDEHNLVIYVDKEYPIVKETFSGLYEELTTADIVPNRLAILRIDKILNKAILTNSPIYGSLQVSDLEVIGNAVFNKIPKYRDPNTMAQYSLVTEVSLDSSRIKYGTQEVDLIDYPDGTVYFKLEE